MTSENNEEQELMIKEYVPSRNSMYPATNGNNNSSFPPSNDESVPIEVETDSKIKEEEGFDENIKPYSCPKCQQAFSRPHNLKSHLTTHSEERPYRCEVCNHHFRRQHDLKRHQKLHTGERPYKCKTCTRSFARLDALNRHCKAEGGSACTLVKQQQMKQQEQNLVRIHDMPFQHEVKKRRSEYGAGEVKTATMTITPPSDASPSSGTSSPNNRPIIPQLQISHPASHLYPKNNVHPFIPQPQSQQLLPSPNVILPKSLSATSPPVYTSQKALPITPSSPPHAKSPLYSSSPWAASPYSPRPTLPPLPANHDLERLAKENEGLKKDINQLRSMAQKEATTLKSKIHDLQVE